MRCGKPRRPSLGAWAGPRPEPGEASWRRASVTFAFEGAMDPFGMAALVESGHAADFEKIVLSHTQGNVAPGDDADVLMFDGSI